MKLRISSSVSGLSILELLIVVFLILILSTISTIAYSDVKRKAEKVVCISKLRSLHAKLATYVVDQGHWPQEPVDGGGNAIHTSGSGFYGWMIEEVASVANDDEVVPWESWVCPTEARKGLHFEGKSRDKVVGSYVPTMFDSGRQTPWKWPNQPWFIERANNHLSGQLMIMADGRVITNEDFKKGK